MNTRHNPNSENEQEQRIECHICGHLDTDHYCSKCGTALVSYDSVGESALSAIRQQLREQLLELIHPIFATLKTFWLIVFKPKPFFGALFRREGKIDDIDFPLTSLWRFLSPDTYQHILDPIQYFLAGILLIFFVFIDDLITFFQSDNPFADSLGDERVTSVVLSQAIQVEGFFLLLFFFGLIAVALCSLVFYTVLSGTYKLTSTSVHDYLTSSQVYTFWIYIWGSYAIAVGGIILVMVELFNIDMTPKDTKAFLVLLCLFIPSLVLMLLHTLFRVPWAAFPSVSKWKIMWANLAVITTWGFVGAMFARTSVGLIVFIPFVLLPILPKLLFYGIMLLLLIQMIRSMRFRFTTRPNQGT